MSVDQCFVNAILNQDKQSNFMKTEVLFHKWGSFICPSDTTVLLHADKDGTRIYVSNIK